MAEKTRQAGCIRMLDIRARSIAVPTSLRRSADSQNEAERLSIVSSTISHDKQLSKKKNARLLLGERSNYARWYVHFRGEEEFLGGAPGVRCESGAAKHYNSAVLEGAMPATNPTFSWRDAGG